MKSMQKCCNVLPVIILTMILLSAVPAAAMEQAPAGELISHTLIREADWTYNWQMNLPIKENETIDMLMVLDSNLYVMTDTNVLFCIDREKGRVHYVTQLSAGDLPVCKPKYYDRKLWFIVGNEMLVFDPRIGNITMRQKFQEIGNTFECGLSRNLTHVYVTGSDNRIHAYNVDGYWHEFAASADNDSPIISAVATDEIVVFATFDGNVIGMNPLKARKYWQFDTTGRIRAELVMDGEYVYVGSQDSKLYKLGLKTGLLDWPTPFHSGAPLRESFVVGQKVLYLYNTLNGLYGVDKETGKAVWQARDGRNMICEAGSKAFVYASPGLIKVMDNNTGAELFSVNAAQVIRYASNTTDDQMYLSDGRGRLMCISVK